MKPGLPILPVLKVIAATVEASHYNHVRLVLRRMGTPQELVLGSRGLSITLDRHAWVLVDRHLEDLPLMAWTDFDTQRRSGLHSPIQCRILLYHEYAQAVRHNVLGELDRRLQTLLMGQRMAGPRSQLVAFRPR
ncbi:MAG: hypothetical protein AB7U81_10175 [Thiohalomonadaceae bacterium]